MTAGTPKVSVIIPIKNGMPWLTATLSSLERQTFKDFEVLAWDNGSTDGTLNILHEWIPGRLNGCVISGDPLPYDKCLSRLVERARCEYLARLDADDLAISDRFEKQVRYLDDHSDVAVVGGQMEFVDENDAVIGRADFLPCSFESILSTMLFQCPLPHPGVMFRRQVALEAGNYRECQPVEDLDLWLRLARVGKLINLPDLVLKYRVHPGSVTAASKKAGQHVQRIFECLRKGVPDLYSVSHATYSKLLAKKHPLAIWPLLSIARRIAKRSGVNVSEVLKSAEFLYSARCLTARRDFFSKAVYFYLGRNPSVSIAKQAAAKIPALRLGTDDRAR
jgi:glycosyltransferase involved in cell wall biosynthesis